MSEILPVTFLVQALSILKGSNTTAPFFPSTLHTGEPSYSNPTSQQSKCIHAAAQSLQVAHPTPFSPQHGIQAPEASHY